MHSYFGIGRWTLDVRRLLLFLVTRPDLNTRLTDIGRG
jgi:hypothetical protein